MALATLSIDLVAQLASLQAGMDKAGRLAEKQAAQIEARYARLTAGAVALGAALATAIPVAGLAAFFRTTVDGLDALNDLKDATGASIENLSALEDVAARTGTSMDTVSAGLLKFNKVLSEAKPGSDAAAMLKTIGLNAEELKRIDPAQALLKTAQALSMYADDGEKARLVQELFGKSTKEMAAFLKDLAEKGQLNATVTREQTEEAEKFNKEMAALAKNVTDVARAVVSDLIPGLNKLFDKLKQTPSRGTSFVNELVSEVQSLRLNLLVTDIENLTDQLSRQPGNSTLQKLLADARKEYEALSREAAKANEVLKGSIPLADDPRNDPRIGRGFNRAKPQVPGLSSKPAGGKSAKGEPLLVGPVLEPAQIQALKSLEATNVGRITALRQELEELLLMQPPSGGGDPRVAEAIDAVIKQIQALDPAARAVAESMARINAALATTPAAKLADARRLVDELQTELGRTTDPQRIRELGQAIDAIYEGIGALPTVAEPVFAQLDDFTKEFANNVQSAFGETILRTLKGDFDNIASLWGNMLLRMVSEAAAADLTRVLFPNFQGSQGSSLANIGSLISSFFAGRALGGPVAAGGMYEVNEKGMPELLSVGGRNLLLMGKQAGQVTPTGAAMAGGASAVVVNNYVTVGGGVSRNEVMAAMEVTKQQTLAAVADAQRRGRGGN